MRIALSGAQSVGKSTILKAMKKLPEFSNYEFVEEIVRNLHKKYGIQINEQGNGDTQLMIANAHYFNGFKKNVVLDRFILDCLVYTHLLEDNIEYWIFNYIHNLWEREMEKIDYVFYFPPEFKIVDDGFRSLDEEFQLKTHEVFHNYIGRNNVTNVHTIIGTVEERMKKIKDIIGV